MIKKLVVLLLATCLTFLVGIKAFAADTVTIDFGNNQEVSSIDSFSGYIDTYHSDYLGADSYQVKDNLQLNLDHRPHDSEPRRPRHHGEPGYRGPFSPHLWIYTAIGLAVVCLLTGEQLRY